MSDDEITVGLLEDADREVVRGLLVDLALEEQERYTHPKQARAEIEHGTPPVRGHFVGENHVHTARDASGTVVGFCWCVLFDPGTGLEGEVAELYVRPEWRGRGISGRLLREAMALFRRRHVTFACVWTRDDNPAALAAYRSAGFGETEQKVLTWLPLP